MKIKVKKLMFLIPIVVGILIFVLLVKFKSKPTGGDSLEQAAYVNVFRVPQLTVIPKVTGFGTVTPCKIWKGYPEVSGKIVWLSDHLDVGEFFKKGQKLLQIDDSVYKLKVIRQKAEIKKIEANLLELAAKEKNYRATLSLQKRTLLLSIKEQKRQRGLAQRKVVSESTLEKQQITTLTQHNNVQNIQTNIDLIPSQMKYLQAQLESAKALLVQAQLDLAHTVIEAPFDCRIAKVNVEISQYVQQGQEMLHADATSASEVVAQLDTGQLSILVLNENIKLGQINLSVGKYVAIPERLGLNAVIKYTPNGKTFKWKAKCERLEPVDPNTRTVGVAAVVYKPYEKRNATRPPFVKGMYCEVDIYGQKQPGCIVIPRTAIHGDMVYKVNADNRLEIKKVKIKYKSAEFAVIDKSLKKGDVIVSSDLVPAIDGMLLDTNIDIALEKEIEAVATGKERLK
jgi:RND family efflux transporter MFP subunit